MFKKPRICIFNPCYAPYRDPVFLELQRRDNFFIDNYLFSATDKAHQYNNFKEELDKKFTKKDILIGNQNSITKILFLLSIFKKKYDLFIIFGHSSIFSLAGIIWCYFKNRPFIYCADSVLLGRKVSFFSKARDLIVKKILKIASAVWIPGAATKNYMNEFNVSSEAIFEGYYCLDNKAIFNSYKKNKYLEKKYRNCLNIPDDAFIFLMVANMTPRRHHINLIHAFQQLETNQKIFLILIGDGTEKLRLSHLCKKDNIKNVIFTGNVKFNDLSKYFAIANSYVHTGTEPYSTAVLYAAIVGLPIITTSYIGAAKDLISDYGKPLVIEPNDINGLSMFMKKLIQNPAKRKTLGSILQRTAHERSVEWGVLQFEKAVKFALKLK